MFVEMIYIDSESDETEEDIWKVKEELEDILSMPESGDEFNMSDEVGVQQETEVHEQVVADKPEFDTSIPTVQPEPKPVQSEPSKPEPEQAGTSNAKKPDFAQVQKELETKWERTRIRAAFLEDDEKMIFVHRIKELNLEKVLGISRQNEAYMYEYIYLMKAKNQLRHLVHSNHRIVSIYKSLCQKVLYNVVSGVYSYETRW